MNRIKAEILDTKQQLGKTGDRSALLKEIQQKQRVLKEIEQYLSLVYGRFSPESFGQEVSWNWIDVAAVTGFNDLFGLYKRLYNRNTPNSSMFYVNL